METFIRMSELTSVSYRVVIPEAHVIFIKFSQPADLGTGVAQHCLMVGRVVAEVRGGGNARVPHPQSTAATSALGLCLSCFDGVRTRELIDGLYALQGWERGCGFVSC